MTRNLYIPFYSIRSDDIDLTCVRDVGGKEEEFGLDISNFNVIKPVDKCDVLRIRVRHNGDFMRAHVKTPHGVLFEFEHDYSESTSDLTFKCGMCSVCQYSNECKRWHQTKNRELYMCLDNTVNVVNIMLHAIRDYYIYKHHLKPKNYLCDPKKYPKDKLYDTTEYDDVVLKFVEFPTFKEYLLRYSEVEIDGCWELAFRDFTHMLLGIQLRDEIYEEDRYTLMEMILGSDRLRRDRQQENIEIKRSKDIARVLAYRAFISTKYTMEQVAKMDIVNSKIEYEIPPDSLSSFLEDLLIVVGIKEGEVKGDFLYVEADIDIPEEHREKKDEVIETVQEQEPEEIQEAEPEEIQVEELAQEVLVLPDGFSIIEDEESERRTLVFKVPNGNREYKRTFTRKSYNFICSVASGLSNLLGGGTSDNSTAVRIYRSLNISKKHSDSIIDELLKQYDEEIIAKNREIDQLRKENFELKLRLEHSTPVRQIKSEEDTQVNELWDGEINHFILRALKQVLKQWEPSSKNDKRRGYDVISEYVSVRDDDTYPDIVYDVLRDLFKSNNSFEARRFALNRVGFELEKTNKGHYRVYPTGHKEYSYILPGTPSDFRSYENGISSFINMLFQ